MTGGEGSYIGMRSPMHPNERSFRARAVAALHALVGGEAQPGHHGRYVPTALDLDHARLVIAGGDTEACLDPAALRSIAAQTGRDVLGIWVDPILAGHRYLIDVVLADTPVTSLTQYRLWLTITGAAFLIPDAGTGPAVEITQNGLRLATTPPFPDAVARTTGVALGQAYLQQAVFADSPFARPLDRNIAR